jgi:TRAP-type C4-dicarboxylate transport system substrate-binding protein
MPSIAYVVLVVFNLLCLSQTSVVAGPAHAQVQDIRITHEFPANLDSRDRATRVFIEEALKRAPHLKFSLYPASGLGIRAADYFPAMASGELTMSVINLSLVGERLPELDITMFPFIPADLDMAMRLKGTRFHRRLQQLVEANGVHILTWWWMPGAIASQRTEISGPTTIKGQKVRAPDGGYGKMFTAAGAKIAPFSPAAEHPRRMKAGEIDVAVTSIESFVAFRMYEQAKFATIGGMGNFMSLQPLAISKAVWDALPLDERAAFEAAADISDQYFEAQQREIMVKAFDAFTKAGAKMHSLDMNEYEAWSRLAKDTVWPGFRKMSPAADELFVALLTSVIKSGEAAAPPAAAAAGARR